MTRDELIEQTRLLIAEGERLEAAPNLVSLRTWLAALRRPPGRRLGLAWTATTSPG